MDKKYKGWEILKMLDENKLKEGQVIIAKYLGQEFKLKINIQVSSSGEKMKILCHNTEEPVLIGDLMLATFTIPKSYLTFDKARKAGKRFKHKDWDNYKTFRDVLAALGIYAAYDINQMLDEEAWEVEEE